MRVGWQLLEAFKWAFKRLEQTLFEMGLSLLIEHSDTLPFKTTFCSVVALKSKTLEMPGDKVI